MTARIIRLRRAAAPSNSFVIADEAYTANGYSRKIRNRGASVGRTGRNTMSIPVTSSPSLNVMAVTRTRGDGHARNSLLFTCQLHTPLNHPRGRLRNSGRGTDGNRRRG